MARNDLSIQAVLTARTTEFDNGMRYAARSAQNFSRVTRREFAMVTAETQNFLKGFGAGIGGKFGGLSEKLFGAGGLLAAGGFAAGAAGIGLITTAFSNLTPVATAAFNEIRAGLLGIPRDAGAAGVALEKLAKDFQVTVANNARTIAEARKNFTNVFNPEKPSAPPGLTEAEKKAFDKNRAALEKAREDAVKRSQFLKFGRFENFAPGRQSFVERGIRELQLKGESTLFKRPDLGEQFDKQVKAADAEVDRIGGLMHKLDEQVVARIAVRRTEQLGRRALGIAGDVGAGIFGAAQNFDLSAFLPPELINRVGGAFKARFMVPPPQPPVSPPGGRPEDLRWIKPPPLVPFAPFGSNEYLRAIHDQPKGKIDEKLLKENEEQTGILARMAEDIAKKITRDRVTVKM